MVMISICKMLAQSEFKAKSKEMGGRPCFSLKGNFGGREEGEGGRGEGEGGGGVVSICRGGSGNDD